MSGETTNRVPVGIARIPPAAPEIFVPAMAARAAAQPHPSAGRPPPALASRPSMHQRSIRTTQWQVRLRPDDLLLLCRSWNQHGRCRTPRRTRCGCGGDSTEGWHQLRLVPARDQPDQQRCQGPARRSHARGCLNPSVALSEASRSAYRPPPAGQGPSLRTPHRARPEPVRQELFAHLGR